MAEGGQKSFGSESSGSEFSMETQQNDVDAFELLLQRNRSEREKELQQIQHDSRPVTGQQNRENIGNFLAKNLEVREHAEASGKENVPLNSANVEVHRPQAVVVEIQGLSQQQRVSSALGTSAFRRQLENLIRGSISRASPGPRSSPAPVQRASPVPAEQPSPSPVPAERPSPVPVERPSPSPAREQIPNTLPEPPRFVAPIAIGNDNVRRDSVSSSSTNSSVDPALQIRDPRGLLGLNGPTNAAPAPVVQNDSDGVRLLSWNDVSDLHHESVVQELSELVHQQLVTSSLQGGFSTVLEYHLRDRLQATGTDGERVEEFVRSLPPTGHVRNDFSNLGLPATGQDNWDNVSVTSISATAVPYTQTNLHLNREISSLKAQMQEMRNMLKVSFDLQLDIQRSIRQEVAAGIAMATGGDTTSPATPRSLPVNDTHCLICLDNFSDSVLYQCGHMCVCYPCGRHLMDRSAKCPVCRAPIRDIIRAYRCNQD